MSAGYHADEQAVRPGGSAARGAMLIAVALVIGLLLMWRALDDPPSAISTADPGTDGTEQVDAADTDATADPGADAGVVEDGATAVTPDDQTATDATPTETIPEVVDETTDPVESVLRPANEVTVLVANGTGAPGVAGATRDQLTADGYTGLVSNAPTTAEAVIFYRPGFDQNALQIAMILGAPPDIVIPVPADGTVAVDPDAITDGRLDDAHVIVIIGADGLIPT